MICSAIVRTDFRPSDAITDGPLHFEQLEDIGASTLERVIGSATQRQSVNNEYHTLLANLDSHDFAKHT